jgi:hypothetical protein
VTGLVCAEGEQTQKGVPGVFCDVFSKHMICVSTHTVYVRRFRHSCFLLQIHHPSVTAAHAHTHTHQRYIMCVILTQRYFSMIRYFLPHLIQTQTAACDTKIYLRLFTRYLLQNGPGSSVGIANCYGLDGPGIEFRCGRDFIHTCRPSLVPT